MKKLLAVAAVLVALAMMYFFLPSAPEPPGEPPVYGRAGEKTAPIRAFTRTQVRI